MLAFSEFSGRVFSGRCVPGLLFVFSWAWLGMVFVYFCLAYPPTLSIGAGLGNRGHSFVAQDTFPEL